MQPISLINELNRGCPPLPNVRVCLRFPYPVSLFFSFLQFACHPGREGQMPDRTVRRKDTWWKCCSRLCEAPCVPGKVLTVPRPGTPAAVLPFLPARVCPQRSPTQDDDRHFSDIPSPASSSPQQDPVRMGGPHTGNTSQRLYFKYKKRRKKE